MVKCKCNCNGTDIVVTDMNVKGKLLATAPISQNYCMFVLSSVLHCMNSSNDASLGRQ